MWIVHHICGNQLCNFWRYVVAGTEFFIDFIENCEISSDFIETCIDIFDFKKIRCHVILHYSDVLVIS